MHGAKGSGDAGITAAAVTASRVVTYRETRRAETMLDLFGKLWRVDATMAPASRT